MPMPQETARRPLPVRRSLEPSRRRAAGIWWAIAVGLLLAVGIPAVAVWFLYQPQATDTVALTSASLEVTLATDTLVVRKEQVYNAPATGSVRRLVEEGQQVRSGVTVVEVTGPSVAAAASASPPTAPVLQPQNTDQQLDDLARQMYRTATELSGATERGNTVDIARLQAQLDGLAARQWDVARTAGASQGLPPVGVQAPPPAPAPATPPASGALPVAAASGGTVMYQVDGLEGRLDPDSANSWTPGWFKMLPPPYPDRIGVGNVEAGQPIYKIVDNFSLGLVMLVPGSAAGSLSDGSRVQVRFDAAPGRTVTTRVAHIALSGEQALLYLTASVFPQEVAALRQARVTLVTAVYEGKVVPRAAVDVRAGQQGVWVREGEAERFAPVVVLGGNDTQLALETDLPLGARILRKAPQQMQ